MRTQDLPFWMIANSLYGRMAVPRTHPNLTVYLSGETVMIRNTDPKAYCDVWLGFKHIARMYQTGSFHSHV